MISFCTFYQRINCLILLLQHNTNGTHLCSYVHQSKRKQIHQFSIQLTKKNLDYGVKISN